MSSRSTARVPILFDLDGTVWDSAPGIIGCMEATLADLELPVPPSKTLRAFLGPPLLDMLAQLGVPAGRLDDARAVYRRHYREHGEFECAVFPGMADLLDQLRSSGHILATATSKGVEPTERMLEYFGLRPRFDVVSAASMTATGHDKSEIVHRALAAVGGPRLGAIAGYMIGDRCYDIEAGSAAGLTTVGVGWGYAPAGELVDAGADHLVNTVEELAALLGSVEDPG